MGNRPRLRESKSRRRCACGVLGKSPNPDYPCCETDIYQTLDHARLFVRDGTYVLIAWIYADANFPEEVWSYATRYGLTAIIDDPFDDLYGHGTTPVRYFTNDRPPTGPKPHEPNGITTMLTHAPEAHTDRCYCRRPAKWHISYGRDGSECANVCGVHRAAIERRKGQVISVESLETRVTERPTP